MYCDFLEIVTVFPALCRFFCNRYLRISTAHDPGQRVEWAYAFDVHLNAFFPLLLILHVVQLFCMQSKYPLFVNAPVAKYIYCLFYFVLFCFFLSGLLLSFESPVALFSTPVANLLPRG